MKRSDYNKDLADAYFHLWLEEDDGKMKDVFYDRFWELVVEWFELERFAK